MRMKITFDKKSKFDYTVRRDGKPVGSLSVIRPTTYDPGVMKFRDFRTGVRGERNGFSVPDSKQLIRWFYERLEGTVGWVTVDDTYEFRELLSYHKIHKFFNEDQQFFFYDEEELTAARLLV